MIYRTAVDLQASDGEPVAWWDVVADELRDGIAARTIADAAQFTEWRHHAWKSVSDTARDVAKRFRWAARELRAEVTDTKEKL
ncbi:hypothetical protein [Pandoraea apista]|uniref:hypothetical protein n=1 Tax=Pandoraea apista TaxID=93218 RepID=UPI0006994D28|nr:hypothetical protein [Pandoraea apista]